MGHRLAAAVERRGIPKKLQQLDQLREAAVDVTDDVEGPEFIAPVDPQALALDLGLLDLLN